MRRLRPGCRSTRTSVALPVGANVKAIYFLHTAAWVQKSEPVAEYRFEFEDGGVETVEVIPLGNPPASSQSTAQHAAASVQDWWPECTPLKNPHARSVFVAHPSNSDARCGRVYVSEWRNPNPRRHLQGITLRAISRSDASLGVLAISILRSAKKRSDGSRAVISSASGRQ